MRVTIVEAKSLDVIEVCQRTVVPTTESQLNMFLRASTFSWVGRADGVAACMWGLIAPTIMSDRAYLWLTTTDLVEKHKFRFIRHSQRHVEVMLRYFPLIIGDADPQQPGAIRWLGLLGAKFGQFDGRFIPFEIRAK